MAAGVAVALLTLGFMVWQSATESVNEPPALGLVAKVRQVDSDAEPAVSAGIPTGGPIEYRLRARNLGNETMHEVTLTLSAPEGVLLLPGSCVAEDDAGRQVPCRIADRSVHAEDASLDGGQVLKASVKGELRPGLGQAGQIAVATAISEEAEETARRAVVYPRPSMGQRAFQAFYRHEVDGRLHWRETVKAAGAREFISPRWHRLTPYGLHRIDAFREALHTRFGQLFDDEGLAARIVVVRATIRGPPLRGRGHLAPGAHELVVRERIPLGGDGHRVAWCTTTVRATHPLRRGDRVIVTAIIVAWGVVYPNGHAVAAVMMICPAIRVLGSDMNMPGIASVTQ